MSRAFSADAGLRLDRRGKRMPNRVGANRASVVPGNSAGSPLYLKLIERLDSDAPADFEAGGRQHHQTWIDQGADWSRRLSERRLIRGGSVGCADVNALAMANRNELENMREDPKVANVKGLVGSTPIMTRRVWRRGGVRL